MIQKTIEATMRPVEPLMTATIFAPGMMIFMMENMGLMIAKNYKI